MNSKLISSIFAAGCGLMVASSALADTPKIEFPQVSPAATVKQRVGLTDVEIDYSRPSVKGRVVFGDLVPYGKVWRTGANQATKIIFSTPVKLNGTEIPAGTYALMTIPDKNEWTIIINKGSEQWGAYKYDEKSDIARIKAKPMTIGRTVETFVINFDDVNDNSSLIDLVWDKTKVPIKLEVDYQDKLVSQIEETMASNDEKKPYFQAAMFYYNHGLDLQKAKKWVDAAIAENEMYFMVHLKAKILAKLGDKEGAVAAAKRSSELAEKAGDAGFEKLNKDFLASLK